MRIKLFHARTMNEALRRARLELGEEALILGHRRVPEGVEVTAALAPPEPELPPPPPPDPVARAQALPYGKLDWSKPIMLIGAPGAGKTLTAAKLATRLVQQGQSPQIITADAERAGATEQLAAFMRILALELQVSENPLSLAHLLASRPPSQKTIIDMAGCNPFHPADAETLATHAVTADATLVWVAAAGQDAEDAAELGQAFAALGARYMLPTKLDLTRRLEGVLRAAEAGKFILTDAGIGAGIIDGIIPLEAETLVSRIRKGGFHFMERSAA